MSSFVYGWGQFIDHDFGLTTTGETAFDVPIPTGIPFLDSGSTGMEIIPMTRSKTNIIAGIATRSIFKSS